MSNGIRKKNGFKLLFIGLFVPLLISQYPNILISRSAQALTMSNSNYNLHMENSDRPSEVPALNSGPNYEIQSGFPYISSANKFHFRVSSTAIDFGALSATNPVTRTQTLTITNGSAEGYSVTAGENHPLLADSNGSKIPDTTCDSGTCTETTAGTWTSSLTYGFGYSLEAAEYKQFADLSNNKAPQIILSGINSKGSKEEEDQITYKVNISTTQLSESYTNQIIYIAIPTF